jgi:RNA polymerase sigma-32 factor
MGSAQHTRILLGKARRCRRLNARDERELIERWQKHGDRLARDCLIQAGMKDVVSIARRYSGSRVPLSDLVSEGTLGLMTAIDRFDPDRGTRLVTYASHWIRARVTRCIMREWKHGRTGMGSMRVLRYFKIKRERARQMALTGDERASLIETAKRMDMSVAEVTAALRSLDLHDTSLDVPEAWGGDDAAHTLLDRLAGEGPDPEEEAARHERLERIRCRIDEALEELDDRERLIASERLMKVEPTTLQQLGRTLGVSRERVRQIEGAARRKLSQMLAPDDPAALATA